MPRPQVIVRAPQTQDVPSLLAMWDELRKESGRAGPIAPVPSESRLRERITQIALDPMQRVMVAEVDGEVVGMTHWAGIPLGPFSEGLTVQVDYLHVRSAFHRRGVGRAFIVAASAFADLIGAEHVTINVFPQAREANRFYARLGFAPLVVRRVAATSVLVRRLRAEPATSRAGILARRRSAQRARASV